MKLNCHIILKCSVMIILLNNNKGLNIHLIDYQFQLLYIECKRVILFKNYKIKLNNYFE